jgi:putative endonuclease
MGSGGNVDFADELSLRAEEGGIIAVMPTAGRIERVWIGAQEWGLGRLGRLGARLQERMHRGRVKAAHLATGERGEQAALFELRRRGYVVVARRWTSPKMRGDVDLIAWDGEWLCFVEVKTRTARDMTPAESAVDDDKRRMQRGLARAYLRVFPERERGTIAVRFDVVSVYAVGDDVEFEVFPGAFGWS